METEGIADELKKAVLVEYFTDVLVVLIQFGTTALLTMYRLTSRKWDMRRPVDSKSLPLKLFSKGGFGASRSLRQPVRTDSNSRGPFRSEDQSPSFL